MTEQKKFELGKTFVEARNLFEGNLSKVYAQRVKGLINAPVKALELKNNGEVTGNRQLAVDLDQIELNGFETEEFSNLSQDSSSVENPQSKSVTDIKLCQQMPTMMDEALNEQQSGQSDLETPKTPLETRNSELVGSVEINRKPLEQFDFTTPQKLKKPMIYEELELSQDYWKLLWAPKKKIKRTESEDSI